MKGKPYYKLILRSMVGLSRFCVVSSFEFIFNGGNDWAVPQLPEYEIESNDTINSFYIHGHA